MYHNCIEKSRLKDYNSRVSQLHREVSSQRLQLPCITTAREVSSQRLQLPYITTALRSLISKTTTHVYHNYIEKSHLKDYNFRVSQLHREVSSQRLHSHVSPLHREVSSQRLQLPYITTALRSLISKTTTPVYHNYIGKSHLKDYNSRVSQLHREVSSQRLHSRVSQLHREVSSQRLQLPCITTA